MYEALKVRGGGLKGSEDRGGVEERGGVEGDGEACL